MLQGIIQSDDRGESVNTEQRQRTRSGSITVREVVRDRAGDDRRGGDNVAYRLHNKP